MDSPDDAQAPAAWETLAEAKRRHVMRVYAACGRNKTRTAETLGVSLKSLFNWLNAWADAGLISREEAGIR